MGRAATGLAGVGPGARCPAITEQSVRRVGSTPRSRLPFCRRSRPMLLPPVSMDLGLLLISIGVVNLWRLRQNG